MTVNSICFYCVPHTLVCYYLCLPSLLTFIFLYFSLTLSPNNQFFKLGLPSAAYFKQKTNASILMDADNSFARKYPVQAASLSFTDVIASLVL